jgi:hypothetical protein
LIGGIVSWTLPADVTGAWIGEDVPTDTAQVQLWIDKAERMVRRHVADIQTRIDAEAEEDPPSTELLDSTVDVVVAMVTRVFRNPSGIRQENETTGPFTTSRTYGGDTPGALYLTEDEIAALKGAEDSTGAFSIDLIPSTSPYYPEAT